MQDHSDHGASQEQMTTCLESIHRVPFLYHDLGLLIVIQITPKERTNRRKQRQVLHL